MSYSSDNSLASIGINAGIPGLNTADIPSNIRNGNSQAQQAYTEGLAFEQVLVNQLSTQIANTMGSSQDSLDSLDSTDSSDSGDSTTSGGSLMSATGAYGSLIPQALTSSIMDSGGLGLAEEFAQTLDPSLADPSTTTTGTDISSDVSGSAGATQNGSVTL